MNSYRIVSYITAALAVILIFSVTFLFVVLNYNAVTNSFEDACAITMNDTQASLDNHIEGLKDDALDYYRLGSLPQNALGAGIYTRRYNESSGAWEYDAAEFADAKGNLKMLQFKSSLYTAIDNRGVSVLPASDLFDGYTVAVDSPQTSMVFFAYTQPDPQTETYVYTVAEINAYLSALPELTNYHDVYLLYTDGGLAGSLTGEGLNGNFMRSLSSDSGVLQDFAAGKSYSFTSSYRDKELFFVVAKTGENSVYRIAGALPQSVVSAYTGRLTAQQIVSAIAVAIVGIAALVVLNYNYRKRYDLIVRARVPMNYFQVRVTKMGKILWADKRFKEKFDVTEVNTHMINDAVRIDREIANSQPIFVKLDGRDGNEYFINFMPYRTPYGFKLIGGDSSRFLKDYQEFKEKKQVDPYTGLPVRDELEKEIEAVLEQNNGIKCLIGKIEPANLEKMSVMMGEYLFRQLLTLYAKHIEAVLKRYGKIYSLSNHGFMFYTDDMEKGNALINNIQEIMKQLSEVFKINDNIINVDSCCGFVVLDARENNVNMDNIIYNCEIALKNATDNKKTRYYILRNFKYDGQHTDFTEKNLVLSMIENKEFEVYYQPQYELKTMRLSGFEGLLRIVSDRKKEISIDKLISIAEQYGGMVELGRFVYTNAMDFAKEIRGRGIEISINVSAVQLMQIGFTEYFLESYREHNLDRGSFNIEITEGTMVHSFDEVAAKLNILKENGVGTHIDDFGVAYSSMLYLQRLPVSVIKIDKSLIDEIVNSSGNAAITQGIINIAKELKMKTIAEGVENREQVKLLEEMNCDYIQGFLMSQALGHDQALQLVKESH